MKKNLLPNSFGPELLTPFLFAAFMAGRELLPNVEILWYIQGLIYLVLLALIIRFNNNYRSIILLLPLIIFHTLLGLFDRELKPSNSYKEGNAFLIIEIKSSNSLYKQTIGKVYKLKGTKLYPTREKTICVINSNEPIQRGDFIFSLAPTKIIKNSGNPGSFDMINYYRTKGIHTQSFINHNYIKIGHIKLWDFWINKLKIGLNQTFEYHLSGSELGLAKALLLGNTAGVSKESRESFSRTGAIHVLAVSGMHVALFAELILFSIGLIPRFTSRIGAILFTLAIIWCYAWLTGFSASVLRAVIMFSLIQIGLLFQRSANPNYLLMWCAYLMYLIDPTCIYDIGFQLSFCAVFGIQTYRARINSLWSPANKIFKAIWEHTAVAISAQLFTVPLILYYFHTFPNFFLIANLGIVVFSGVVMYLGFGFLLLGWIPIIGNIIGKIFSFSIALMDGFVSVIANLPGAVEGGFSLSIEQLLLIVLGLIYILYFNTPSWSKYLLGLVLIFGLSVKRQTNQMESHLMILNSNSPVLIYKQKMHVVMFSDYKNSRKSLNHLLSDYKKIYPFNSARIQIVTEPSKVGIDDLTFTFNQAGIVVQGSHIYSILKTKKKRWVIQSLDQKTKLLQKAIKLPI